MGSYGEVRVIQPSDIEVQKYTLQMLLINANILWFLTVQEGVVDLINKQVGFLTL